MEKIKVLADSCVLNVQIKLQICGGKKKNPFEQLNITGDPSVVMDTNLNTGSWIFSMKFLKGVLSSCVFFHGQTLAIMKQYFKML